VGFAEYLGEPLNQTWHNGRKRIHFPVDSRSQELRRNLLAPSRGRKLLRALSGRLALAISLALAFCALTPFGEYHLGTSDYSRRAQGVLTASGQGEWSNFRGVLALAQEPPNGTPTTETVSLLTRQPFGGGAITNISATETSQLFLTAQSPDGISIYKFTPSLNLFEKVLSSTYLESVLNEKTNLSSLKIEVSDDGRNLAIYDENMGRIVIFDLSAHPLIKRTSLALPKNFVPGGASFLEGDKFLTFSKGIHFGKGQQPIALLDLNSGTLQTFAIQAELAVILQLKPLSDDFALVMGYFDPFQKLGETEVGLLSMKDGKITPWRQTGVLLADARDGRIALVAMTTAASTKKSEAIVLDSEPASDSNYQLLILDENGERAPAVSTVPIYLPPKWLALGKDANFALLVTEEENKQRTLWLIDLSTKEKELIEKGVQLVDASIATGEVFVLPARENSIAVYQIHEE